MTERAWMLLSALFCACLLACWNRISELSHKVDMVIIVQQSHARKISLDKQSSHGKENLPKQETHDDGE